MLCPLRFLGAGPSMAVLVWIKDLSVARPLTNTPMGIQNAIKVRQNSPTSTPTRGRRRRRREGDDDDDLDLRSRNATSGVTARGMCG